ncbi:hypothetical protein RclHR1_00470012 [Rhizophagus clarus]|uniref:Ubiquitin-like domain-containing protein n=1 Tax=Rhizophagus clarus TaxID=94130 RepID=A0A2Z6S1H7_9GLOM|nr:hypothetical protein RclHR1_00470012 [Rhizophagus clarus]GES91946.1 hypothetical protein RCL_jg25790.t1 [Rhizophagus clarus]
MSQLSLVASAMSSILDIPVKTYDECVANEYTISPEQILDINFVHTISLMHVKNEVNEVEDTFFTFTTSNLIQIFVVNLSGDSQAIFIDPYNTVLELKYTIQEKFDFDIRLIRLEFANKRLEDHKTLKSYNIQHGNSVHVSLRLLGGIEPKNYYVIKKDFLDPKYDFDFTDLEDDGKKHYRGQRELYRRPYGWNRIALNVSGKYGHDNRWLGYHGDSPYEWPVSYHGTNRMCFDPIAEEGYRLDKGKRILYGKGIYSTPMIEVAEIYSKAFMHNGVSYKAVFQNRVGPGFNRHYPLGFITNYEYWVTPDEKNIRPYGLCVKKTLSVFRMFH